MQEILDSFLETEITDQEYYDAIIRFIYSGNIRCGEYECNQFVIRKMDLSNFIIYEEYVINKKREIHHSFSLSKNKLLQVMNEYAKKQGFLVRSFEWSKGYFNELLI
jgi:hypothetical protein